MLRGSDTIEKTIGTISPLSTRVNLDFAKASMFSGDRFDYVRGRTPLVDASAALWI
jgi:hypothetical protein